MMVIKYYATVLRRRACLLRVMLFLFSASFLCVISLHSSAGIEAVSFSSESQRLRYARLINELRCPKCQNQNLSGSDSQIAQDLRSEVARLVNLGKTDQEVKTYMVNRYGDFVLYMPPVQDNTLALWLGPALMFAAGIAVFFYMVMSRRRVLRLNTEEDSDHDDHLQAS